MYSLSYTQISLLYEHNNMTSCVSKLILAITIETFGGVCFGDLCTIIIIIINYLNEILNE